MTVNELIRDLRVRLDDNPVGGVPNYFTDANLLQYINNTRKYLSRELGLYKRQDFIMPELYIDEYDLPTDFRSIDNIFDVYNQVIYSPLNQPNTETTKQYTGVSTYDNLFYINEIRKKLTLLEPSDYPELAYLVKSFSRSGKTIVIDGSKYETGVGTIAVSATGKTVTLSGGLTSQLQVGYAIKDDTVATHSVVTSITNLTVFVVGTTSLSTGTGAWTYSNKYSDVSKWANVKGYIEINDTSAGVKEYARVSKVVQTATTDYTLYVSSFDLKGDYKNNLKCYGTVALTNTSTGIVGTGTVFNTDLAVGDRILYDNATIGQVSTITNNTHFYMNTAVTTATATNIIYAESRPVFVDNDEVKFVPYIMNYSSLSKPLVHQYESDEMPLDMEQLIPIHSAIEAEMRRSRPDKANMHRQEYAQEIEKLVSMQTAKKNDLYNMGLTYEDYRNIRR